MKILLTPLLFLALLTIGSCKKDDPQASLPPATQEGKNTAGCLINGQAFVAQSYGGDILSPPTPAMSGGFSFDSLYCLFIHGKYNGQGVEVMLFLRGERTGIYLLNRTTPYYPQSTPRYALSHATYRTVDSYTREVYVTDARHTGRVELTKGNIQQGLSAGTFSFTAVSNQDSIKTITITDGRFDRKL